VLIGLIVLVVLAAAGAGGGYLYIRTRLDKIRRVPVNGIQAQAISEPENILLTGSDSRTGQPAGAASHFGSSSLVAGQRSDVIILLHIDPRTSKAAMMSIPRDTLVKLAGTGHSAKINDAFNTGPSQLIETITQNFGITINHYAAVDFTGLMNLTDAVGGVCMNFPYPVKDGSPPPGYANESGLSIPTAGQHVLDGNIALAFVRSRYYRYYKDGYWHSEGTGDIGRIVRQHEFLRALASKAVHDSKHNPLTANALINHAVNDLTVDSGLSSSDILHLALQFMALNPSQIPSWTLPYRAVSGYGSLGDVLLPEPGPDQQAISAWESYGAPTSTPAQGGATTTTLVPASVHVQVLNGSGVPGQAARAAASLRAAGFTVTSYGTGPSFGHTASVVSYAKGALAPARTLAAAVRGGVVLREDPTLSGQAVVLTTGTSFAGVTAASAPTATTAPGPGGAAAPPTDAVPPWDPTPC
jgi:LCP family protein required for cell wall assembly